MSLSYRNQSIDLQSKSMNWFLYERSLRHERLNEESYSHFFFLTQILLKTFQRNFMGSLSGLSQIQQNIVIFLDFMRATETCSCIKAREFFKIFLRKHVRMDWKHQGILKSSIYLVLKYVFMYLTHFIQVPSAFNDLNSVLYILRIPKKYQFMSQIFLLSANIS